MMGAPWFKLYAQDFLADTKVRLLDDASVGVLVKLWCVCCADGGFPSDPKSLGKILSRRPDHAHQAFLKVALFFVDDPDQEGIKISLRLHSETDAYQKKCLKLKVNGSKGGRPKTNQMVNQMVLTSENQMHLEPEPEPEPEKETTTTTLTDVSQPEATKPKNRHKPKGRDFGIGELDLPDPVIIAFTRVWKGWPMKGWNFGTKTEAPRRINREQSLARFSEIIKFSHIDKADGSRLTEEELADAALAWVNKRVKEARGSPPCVPCIGNFFSSVSGEKNPWKDAVLEFFELEGVQ
jgi:hypothetical protein